MKLQVVAIQLASKLKRTKGRKQQPETEILLSSDESDCTSLSDSCSESLSDGSTKRRQYQSFKCLSFLPTLPDELQLQILTFVYDEVELIESILERQRCTFRIPRPLCNSVFAESIRQDTKNDELFCRICSNAICYPYQLMDCKHTVCGICAFICRDGLRPCSCGIRLRSRPKRLGGNAASLAEARAYWLLDGIGHYKWYKRNEIQVDPGPYGYFGRYGTPNAYDPFEKVAFESDFDGIPIFDLRTHHNRRDDDMLLLPFLLPNRCRPLVISLWPAHENYQRFDIEELKPNEVDARSIARRDWLLHISSDDIVTLEEIRTSSNSSNSSTAGATSKKARRKRFKIRLIGWEQNVGRAADYDF
eukprot:scaffold26766_cov166-Cylindrotheca_fusiformis.AAC.3